MKEKQNLLDIPVIFVLAGHTAFLGGQMFQQLEAVLLSLQWAFRRFLLLPSILSPYTGIHKSHFKEEKVVTGKAAQFCATAKGRMSQMLPWKLPWVPKAESLEFQNLLLSRFPGHPKEKEIPKEIYRL